MRTYKREMIINLTNKTTLECRRETIGDLFLTSDELLAAVYCHVAANLRNEIAQTIAVRYSINPFTGKEMKTLREYDATELNDLISLAFGYVEDNKPITYDELLEAVNGCGDYVSMSECNSFIESLHELKDERES